MRRISRFPPAAALGALAALHAAAASSAGAIDIAPASVSAQGTFGNAESVAPAVSADGRWVAFESAASNLVPGDSNGFRDIFLLDRKTRALELVSVATGGAAADDDCGNPKISGNGRYVVFESAAVSLGGFGGGIDVFVRDRKKGTTTMISRSVPGGSGLARVSSITANGRFVGMGSDAADLVEGDSNGVRDGFVHDRKTGTTRRVTLAADGSAGNAASQGPVLSKSGRRACFASRATNLDGGAGRTNLFVSDLKTGRVTRVIRPEGGGEPDGAGFAVTPTLSANGRYVATGDESTNLASPASTASRAHVYRFDVKTGAVLRLTFPAGGVEADAGSTVTEMSANGRVIAFLSFATTFSPGDALGNRDCFVVDVRTSRVTRVTETAAGQVGDAGSTWIALSGRGNVAAISTRAGNLAAGDAADTNDIFVATID